MVGGRWTVDNKRSQKKEGRKGVGAEKRIVSNDCISDELAEPFAADAAQALGGDAEV